ncbi:hypothetical protein [Robinsoniella sp. RHS]|uniref:hypothetical protein n=1 Tax=Robinsoniella sp. RHS TaxID=1504536 RepID=UPI0026CC1A08
MGDKWWLGVSYADAKSFIHTSLATMARSYIAVGYYIRIIKDNRGYEEEGYQSVHELAEAEFGMKRQTVDHCVRINERFSVDGYSPVVDDQYKEFKKSQLQELLYFTDQEIQEIKPEMTVKQIREMRKEKCSTSSISEAGKNVPEEEPVQAEKCSTSSISEAGKNASEEEPVQAEKCSTSSISEAGENALVEEPIQAEKCSTSSILEAERNLEAEELSALGYPKREYPEGSYAETAGCGKYDCFDCCRVCNIRQEACYCMEAPLGNPFPCTTLGKMEDLQKQKGERCQFVNLDLAEKIFMYGEPRPCCKKCQEECSLRCQRPMKKEKEWKENQEKEPDQKPDSEPDQQILSFTKDGEGMKNAYGATCAAVVYEYLRTAYDEEEKAFEAVVLGKKYKAFEKPETTMFCDDLGKVLFQVENSRLEEEYHFFNKKPEEEPKKEQGKEPEKELSWQEQWKQGNCPEGIGSCVRQEWGTDPVQQEAGATECKKCWSKQVEQSKILKRAEVEEAAVTDEINGKTVIEETFCKGCHYDVKNCCNYPETADNYCVMGSKYKPATNMESEEAEVEEYTVGYFLQEEEEKLSEILEVGGLPEKMVQRQKIMVAALRYLSAGLDQGKETAQSELLNVNRKVCERR